ncbi:MAG TPA: isoprenylcysteine carboxylmethyltransferase family protein [Gemmatimonadaceae bacterium]|nr:isoprenylcysteine carboxylmethyltransferase family protein [Gemmatimonadaceae bacterium]
MSRALAIRTMALYLPIALALLPCAIQAPPRRRLLGAALASAWNLVALLAVNAWAVRTGWWHFAQTPASLLGVPADLLLGWVVLWGCVPALLLPRVSLVKVIAAAAVMDMLLMPLMAPVLRLDDRWLIGEAVAIAVALIPSQLLARWTANDEHAGRRGAMQAIVFAAGMLWLVPVIVFERAEGGWYDLRERWDAFGGLALQAIAFLMLPGIAAVREFARRGGGTPIPFDPPRRLVTSGPYAYVANPMQLSATLVMLGWGWMLGSWWVALAGPMAFLYGIGFANADERATLGGRFGRDWRWYRANVPNWIPRWRPYHPAARADAEASPARLYVAATCGPCSEVARWFTARRPLALLIVPAEEHPTRSLSRVTYDPGDGTGEEEGVAAIARALEHIDLGWATLGWFARAPGICPMLQLLVDASGGEARLVTRTGMEKCAR